jgi:predicted acylesterase/phospholipase RssA
MKGLALDGGGVFGIGQAHIVCKCDLDKFDFLSGTSIGAAIALRVALGVGNDCFPKFFHDKMPKIFKGHKYRQYMFWKAKYGDKELNKALQELLPGKFGDCQRPVFIPVINLGTKRLKVFSSLDPADSIVPAWEIARAAVAAETYFPPWGGNADGGVIANNPSMVATAAARGILHADLDSLELLSIGTGVSAKQSKTPTKSWGSVRWGAWLLGALLEGSASSMHEYFVKILNLHKYARIQFIRDKSWSMDNPKSMLAAEKAWKPEIAKGIEVVKAF